MDFGRSDHPGVQAQLDRLASLSVPQGRLGLETIRAMMERLDNPHRKLPPVFHVAGTNGKGSTCAFLRAMLEADGKRVHVTTSPHLVRYNERIRLAGKLIEDEALAGLLREVLDACDDLAPSFFEVTIAAAFLAFSRAPADACVVEVGLGGRFDATNVLEPEAVAACGIAALGIDHERFLLAPEEGVPKEPLARIAFEKAGIAKKGVPLVALQHSPEATRAIIDQASAADALPTLCGRDWHLSIGSTIELRDRNGVIVLAHPALPGQHQAENAALAAAMLRHQDVVSISREALSGGITNVSWPARLQTLSQGPLTDLAPDAAFLLDGGHNADAAQAIAAHLEARGLGRLHAIVGMLGSKDDSAFLAILAPHLASLTAVPIAGHDYQNLVSLAARARVAGVPETHTAPSLEAAVSRIALPLIERPGSFYPPYCGTILIAGSLYLAGEVLRLNDEIPD